MIAMAIMTRKEWVDDTARAFHRRSTELQALDVALDGYHLNGKTKVRVIQLKKAFDDWVGTKNNGALGSIRNKKNAVEHLREQINAELGPGVQNVALSGIDQVVLQPIAPKFSATATASTMTDDAQVTVFANAVKAMWNANWDTLSKKQRGEGLIQAVKNVHTACNIPNVKSDVKVLADGYNGSARHFSIFRILR
jgi:hypothetical protein